MQIENSPNSKKAGRTKIIKNIINTPQVCRRWKPEGSPRQQGKRAALIDPGLVPAFIYELDLPPPPLSLPPSQTPENLTRRSWSTLKDRGKWKLGVSHNVYS